MEMEMNIELDNEGFSKEEFADVKRCLETLFSIRAGSQPLDRNIGIAYEWVMGYPLNVAENMLALEIVEKVDLYEPRVEVVSVDFEENADGQIKPSVFLIKRQTEEEE